MCVYIYIHARYDGYITKNNQQWQLLLYGHIYTHSAKVLELKWKRNMYEKHKGILLHIIYTHVHNVLKHINYLLAY